MPSALVFFEFGISLALRFGTSLALVWHEFGISLALVSHYFGSLCQSTAYGPERSRSSNSLCDATA